MLPLRIGLIGLGHFGKHYARLLQVIPGAEFVAVASTTKESIENSNVELDARIIRAANAHELLEDTSIDAVVIATPPSTHADLICEALQAGKHVLVEKPMVLSLAEAKKVEKEVKSSGKIFMVGFQYVFNEYIRYIKEHIESLGAIKYVVAENLYPGPLRADVGVFMDAGIHDFSIFEYLFSPGTVVDCTGASRSFGNSTHDDFAAATVTFANGLMAHMLTSWYWPEKVRKLTIVGDKGMVLFNDRDEIKLRWIEHKYPVWNKQKSSLFLPGLLEQKTTIPTVEAQEPLMNELSYFIECVRTHTEPVTGIEFGYKITTMMDHISEKLNRL
ncbi:MAG: Gfo/Idh/MocA family oxidoreductase [Candidatus Magasanikbacteria bacterium]|nr:Gfo/Idh/MocA family oxidoreductase [Candidatus Magasanikbacteria bacterium]